MVVELVGLLWLMSLSFCFRAVTANKMISVSLFQYNIAEVLVQIAIELVLSPIFLSQFSLFHFLYVQYGIRPGHDLWPWLSLQRISFAM